MNKEELKNLVKQEIDKAVAEEFKGFHDNKKSLTNSTRNLHGMDLTDTDIDNALFFGLNGIPDKKKKSFKKPVTSTINEATDRQIRILASEIKEFENSFKELLSNTPGANLALDKQPNGYSIMAMKKPDGIEIVASGVINLGRNGKVHFNYSVQNGLTINADNLKISNSNKDLIEGLFGNFSEFEKSWREKMNFEDNESVQTNSEKNPEKVQ